MRVARSLSKIFRRIKKQADDEELLSWYLPNGPNPEIDIEKAHLAAANFELSLKSDTPRAYVDRGIVYVRMGNVQQAIEDFSMAISLSPKLAKPYSLRGAVYHQIGQFKEAIEDYTIYLELVPNNVTALYHRGRALYLSGKLDEAITDFDRSIALNPNLDSIYLERGTAYALQKEYEKALHDYTEYLLRQDTCVAHVRRGFIYINLENYEQAIQDFDAALALDPNNCGAMNNKAYTLLKLGRASEGLPLADKLVNLCPHYSIYLHTRGKILAELGRIQEAVRDYKDALAQGMSDDEATRREMQKYIAENAEN